MCLWPVDSILSYFSPFQDKAYAIKQELSSSSTQPSSSSKSVKKRLCLILDCLVSHDFGTKTSELINLQHHVIREKKLSEKEAVIIFRDVVRVVQHLHKVRVIWFIAYCVKTGRMLLRMFNIISKGLHAICVLYVHSGMLLRQFNIHQVRFTCSLHTQ